LNRRRWIALGVLGIPAAVLVLALAFGAWIATTESGLRWAVALVRPWLPEGVELDRAEGVLVGPLELHGLSVHTGTATVRIARMSVDWQPADLLVSRIHVLHLDVSGVDIALARRHDEKPTGHEGGGPALPDGFALPGQVVLDRLRVDDIVLRMAGGSTQRVARVEVAARGDGTEVNLTRLEVDSDLLDMDGQLRAGTRAPFAVDGRIRWHARPPGGVAPMGGVLTLGGTAAALDLVQRWDEPTPAQLRAHLRLFSARPQWNARLELPPAAARAWLAQAPALTAGTRLRLSGTLDRVDVAGDFSVEGLPTGPLKGAVEAAADAAGARVRRLHVARAGQPGRATASGSVDWSGAAPRFDVDLSWADLHWPLESAAPAVRSPAGELQVRGTSEDYTLSGGGRLLTPQAGATPVRAEWNAQGSRTGLSEFRVAADWHESHLTAAGDLRWQDPGSVRADVTLDGFEPQRVVDGVSGRLGSRLHLEVDWTPKLVARVHLQALSGDLNGRPVGGSGRVTYTDGTVRIEQLQVSAADARVTANGTVGQRMALQWSVRVPDLSRLVPAAEGRVEGSGRIEGTPEHPGLAFTLSASRVRAFGATLESLQSSGRVAGAADAASRIDLEARNLLLDAVAIDSIQAHLEGTRAAHRIELQLASDMGSADVALSGGLDGTDWAGRLVRATLAPPRQSALTLEGPAQLAVSDGTVALEQACWRRDASRLCIDGEGGAAGWHARVDATSIALADLGVYWRGDLEFAGTVDATADVRGAGGTVTGKARLAVSSGAIRGVVDEERETLIAFEPGHAEVTLAAGRVDGLIELPLSGGGRIAASVRVDRTTPARLAGRVQARVDDLGLLVALVPRVGRAEGALVADLELSGTIASPGLSGSARLDAGRLFLTDLGIELRDLELGLDTSGRTFTLSAAARSGEGDLHADLRVRPGADGEGWSAEGQIDGTRFTAADLPEARVVVSPQLRWRVDGHEVHVVGEVDVPSAQIEPRDLSGAVRASPDAVIVGQRSDQPEPVPVWRVFADVHVVLGSEVTINAFGLDGRLGGDLQIRERPGQLTSALGELRVEEGTYTIYRQTLTIERGRVLFDGGPIADPGLDVRAVRKPRDVVVGVNVRGTLRRPKVDLFSEPPMQESQVLSYLIVGVPLGETSSGEQSAVATAAAALATSREGTRLASDLGIEQVSVEQGTGDQGASLVLGRYLSPRLYVGYGIGLMEQANSVRMRYDLTRRWTVEARSGAVSSADLLYSIEVDTTSEAIRGVTDQ